MCLRHEKCQAVHRNCLGGNILIKYSLTERLQPNGENIEFYAMVGDAITRARKENESTHGLDSRNAPGSGWIDNDID